MVHAFEAAYSQLLEAKRKAEVHCWLSIPVATCNHAHEVRRSLLCRQPPPHSALLVHSGATPDAFWQFFCI